MEARNPNSLVQLSDQDSLFLENVFIDVRKYLQIVATSYSEVPVLIFPPVNSRLRFLIHRFVEDKYKGKGFATFSIGRLHQRRIVIHPVAQDLSATSVAQDEREPSIKMDASGKPKSRRRGSNKKPDRAIYVPKFRRGINDQLGASSEDALESIGKKEKSESSRRDRLDFRPTSDKSKSKGKVRECVSSSSESGEDVSSNGDQKSKVSQPSKTRKVSGNRSSDFSRDETRRVRNKSEKNRNESREESRLSESDDSLEGKETCSRTRDVSKSESSDSSSEESTARKSKNKKHRSGNDSGASKDRKNVSGDVEPGNEETIVIANSECSDLSSEERDKKKSKNEKGRSRGETSCKGENENISRRKKSEKKRRRVSENSGRKKEKLPLIDGDATSLLEREKELRERILQRFFRAHLDNKENMADSKRNSTDSSQSFIDSRQTAVESKESAVHTQQNIVVSEENMVITPQNSTHSQRNVVHSEGNTRVLEANSIISPRSVIDSQVNPVYSILPGIESPRCETNCYSNETTNSETCESPLLDNRDCRNATIRESTDMRSRDANQNESYFRVIPIAENPESCEENANNPRFRDIPIIENAEYSEKNENERDPFCSSSKECSTRREYEEYTSVDGHLRNCQIVGKAEGVAEEADFVYEHLISMDEGDIATRIASDETAVVDLTSSIDDSEMTDYNTNSSRFDNTLRKDLPSDDPFSNSDIAPADLSEESKIDDCVDLTTHSDLEEGEYVSEGENASKATRTCDTDAPEDAKRKKLSSSTENEFYGPELPPRGMQSAKASEIEKGVEECGSSKMNVDDHDWDELFSENGEYVDPSMMEELSTALGKVSVKKASQDYRAFQTDEERTGDGECIVEVYDFPASFTTSNLMNVFMAYRHQNGFYIKWVDETHALAVFPNPRLADEALNRSFLSAKTRPLNQATAQSKAKAVALIPAPATRPVTCASLARRLVSSALGVRIQVAEDQKSAEKRLLAEAKERKKVALQQRKEIWEGQYRSRLDE